MSKDLVLGVIIGFMSGVIFTAFALASSISFNGRCNEVYPSVSPEHELCVKRLVEGGDVYLTEATPNE